MGFFFFKYIQLDSYSYKTEVKWKVKKINQIEAAYFVLYYNPLTRASREFVLSSDFK